MTADVSCLCRTGGSAGGRLTRAYVTLLDISSLVADADQVLATGTAAGTLGHGTVRTGP